jgi:hypothetical protein
MNEQQYRGLVTMIGIGAAALEYSKHVPFTDPFWDELSLQDWVEVCRKAGSAERKVIVGERMRKQAQSFKDRTTVFLWAENDSSLRQEIVAEIAQSASSIDEWLWVVEATESGEDLHDRAVVESKKLALTHGHWDRLYHYDKASLANLGKLAETATRIDDLDMVILHSLRVEGGEAARRVAETKLEAMFTDFSAWRTYVNGRGRDELKRFGFRNLLEHCQSFEHCWFAYEQTRLYTWAKSFHPSVMQKILSLDLDFYQAKNIADKEGYKGDEVLKQAMHEKMAEKANSQRQWTILYECTGGELKERALQELLKLTSEVKSAV